MALHFELKVNSHSIGMLYAQRIDGTNDADSVGTYRCDITHVYSQHRPDPFAQVQWEGEVEHRYGDGAWALVARILAAAGMDHPADGGGLG